eukprot:TRINITY_DN4356_c0_g1_i2.p2 TRINITY_DN4356_c0_g1~~TRINITY_DN4356_c0_g1_i2.p2  ORF type:complete len:267 (+),score=62.78 TRINITY_DN4356_c0_g1_i2:1019-1819(+)
MFSEAMRLSWDNPAPLRAPPPPTRTTSAAAAGTALNKSLLGAGTASAGTSGGRSSAPHTPFKVGGPGTTVERRRLSFSMCTSASPASQAQTAPPPPALGSGTAVGGADMGRAHGSPPPAVGAKRGRDGLAPPQQQSPSGSVDRVSTASQGKQPYLPDLVDGVVCAGAASKLALAPPPASSAMAMLHPEDVARRLAAYAARGFPPSTLARFEAAVRQAAVEHDVTGWVLCCGEVEELAKVLTQYYKGGTSTGALCMARSFIQTECRS